jgi:hypothetical protein
MDDATSAFMVGPGIWRELNGFSSDAICLVLASEVYMEHDYIRNLQEFERWRTTANKYERD